MTVKKTEKRMRTIRDGDLLRAKKVISLEDFKKIFAPPVTYSGAKETLAQDSSLDPFYESLYGNLTQHAYMEGQYPMTGFVGYGALQQIAQNSIIRACVKTIADEATREWIQITGGDKNDDGTIDDEESEKIEKLSDFSENKYHLRTLFNKAMATVGFMGGAFIFIDTGADDPSVPLTVSKFSDEFGEDKELKFVVVDPVNCSPAEVNQAEPLKDDYMKPQVWWVLGKKVHTSRLITLIENEPPTLLKPAYNYLGIPRAQLLWDYVLHFNKARVTAVELLEKLNLTVFKTNVADMLSTDGGLSQLDDRMGGLVKYRNNNSVLVVDQEEEAVENITITTQGATDIARQALEFVACANRTPIVKTLGISPNGFSTGEADLANFYDHLHSEQELYRDGIMMCLRAIQVAEFGEIDSTISFDFNKLGADDKSAEAQSASTRAQTLLSLQGQNVISAEEVREAVRKDDTMGLEFLGEELPPQEGQGGDLASMLGGLTGGQGGEPEASPDGLDTLLDKIHEKDEQKPTEEVPEGVKALVAELKEGKDENSDVDSSELGLG